jgi:hypothetical protein
VDVEPEDASVDQLASKVEPVASFSVQESDSANQVAESVFAAGFLTILVCSVLLSNQHELSNIKDRLKIV